MTILRAGLRRALFQVLLLALTLGFAGLALWAPPAIGLAQPTAAVAQVSAHAATLPGIGPTLQALLQESAAAEERLAADPFVRSELFFGTNKDGVRVVSDEAFAAFIDREVTPRFPDGLTLVPAYGQFRTASGRIERERSFQLILLYPVEARKESSAKIEQIRVAYKQAFGQESVLRVDDVLPVRTSF